MLWHTPQFSVQNKSLPRSALPGSRLLVAQIPVEPVAITKIKPETRFIIRGGQQWESLNRNGDPEIWVAAIRLNAQLRLGLSRLSASPEPSLSGYAPRQPSSTRVPRATSESYGLWTRSESGTRSTDPRNDGRPA